MTRDDRSTVIQGWIERLGQGDDSARNELLTVAQGRLERLARKMLRGFPLVRAQEQTGDVLQNALIRFDRELKEVVPVSTQEFFRRAARQIRLCLIDLARHYRGSRNMTLRVQSYESDGQAAAPDPADDTQNQSVLNNWTDFHEAVDTLPREEQLLFGLLWYLGLTQAEAASILEIPEKQVSRLWIAARLRLRKVLEAPVPD